MAIVREECGLSNLCFRRRERPVSKLIGMNCFAGPKRKQTARAHEIAQQTSEFKLNQSCLLESP